MSTKVEMRITFTCDCCYNEDAVWQPEDYQPGSLETIPGWIWVKVQWQHTNPKWWLLCSSCAEVVCRTIPTDKQVKEALAALRAKLNHH